MRTAHAAWVLALTVTTVIAASCAGGGGDSGLGSGGTAGAGPGAGGSKGIGGSTSSSTTSSSQASTGAVMITTSVGGLGGGTGFGGSPSTTVTGLGGSGGGAQACGTLMFSDPTCQACADGSCCSALAACDVGTPCYKIINCVALGHAETTCYNQHPNGQAAYDAFNACLGGSCGTECGYCPGNLIQYSDPSFADCNTCLNANCCAPFSQLSDDYTADPDCGSGGPCPPTDDLNTCEGDATNAVCMTDPDAAAAAACVVAQCDAICPLPICDSGIVVTGPSGCAACLGTNCCSEFEAFQCAPPAGVACMTNLDDFNTCSMDSTCNNNSLAQAAAMCSAAAGCQTICGF